MTIFHTGITVSNLERSIEFYRDVLGLELEIGPMNDIEGEELSRGVGVPNAKLRQAVFKAGEGRIELFEYLRPPSSVDAPLAPNNLGVMHVCFQVDDAEAKYSELKAKGVTFLTPVNYIDDGPMKGWKWVYFRDPDGITLEMVETGPSE